jgi:hypothetical protein
VIPDDCYLSSICKTSKLFKPTSGTNFFNEQVIELGDINSKPPIDFLADEDSE